MKDYDLPNCLFYTLKDEYRNYFNEKCKNLPISQSIAERILKSYSSIFSITMLELDTLTSVFLCESFREVSQITGLFKSN